MLNTNHFTDMLNRIEQVCDECEAIVLLGDLNYDIWMSHCHQIN